MTRGVAFFRPTRLSKRAVRPGGLDMDQAVTAAERKLEGMREAVLAALDEALTELRGDLALLKGGDAGAAARMAATSDRIAGLAALPGLEPVAEAAGAFCRYAARMRGLPSPQAAQVFVETLVLFRTAGEALGPAQVEALLQGLAALEGKATAVAAAVA